jgi:hypothetical protein
MIVATSTTDKDGDAINAMAKSNPSTVAMNP